MEETVQKQLTISPLLKLAKIKLKSKQKGT